MADVADKIVRQLNGETRRVRDLEELRRNPPLQSSDVRPLAAPVKKGTVK